MKLDKTDKRILVLLDQNARMSFAEIGREIGLSRTAVQDRVTKLENKGVIRGYRADYTAESSGVIHALIFVIIKNRPCDPALDWLSCLPGVQEVLSITGEIDAVVRCALTSPAELTVLNDKIGASDLIVSSTSSLVLKSR